MRPRRSPAEFSLSFLDVICCGFGAVILLLMITKTVQPQVIEQVMVDAESAVAELTEQLSEIRGETTILNRDLNVKREQISEYEEKIAILQGALTRARSNYETLETTQNSNSISQERLAITKQTLSEEEKKLLGLRAKKQNDLIGGIPVDSEYVIVVVDTSGSMRDSANWPRVLTEIEAIFSIYPEMLGLQVLDASGRYVLPSAVPRQWVQDSAMTRRAIRRALDEHPSSVSDPIPGITKAINDFYKEDTKISIYYLGDDYMAPSSNGIFDVFQGKGRTREIQSALDEIDRINPADKDGRKKVTIHAIGFPVLWGRTFGQFPIAASQREKFATLMREMTHRNGGVFVGINYVDR